MTHELHPGDLVLFVRLTLRDVRSWADLLGWLSNWAIALTQRLFSRSAMGDYDGLWECVHAAVIIQDERGLRLLESTAPRGVCQCDPHERIAAYRGQVLVLPLNQVYALLWDDESAERWLQLHCTDTYRWGGLPFALLLAAVAWEWPGAMFCSELVMDLYQHVGIVPEHLPVLRGRRVVEARLKPQCYSPAECGLLPQLARSEMYIWHK